ncbi:MAG: hypothetical protein JNJ60_24400 [Rhodocyclaceae bacterium]|nr:hypothetical protein [Rhodocyclaceae bacterium]
MTGTSNVLRLSDARRSHAAPAATDKATRDADVVPLRGKHMAAWTDGVYLPFAMLATWSAAWDVAAISMCNLPLLWGLSIMNGISHPAPRPAQARTRPARPGV